MDGLRRSIERGAVMSVERNGYQKPAIAGLWAVLMLFAGWIWSTNAEAQRDTAAKIQAQAQQVQASQERIATLEEAVRGLNRSLDRIEAGVNELRRERTR